MRAEDQARSAETREGRAPVRRSQAVSRTRPPALLALQSSLGNAAVVQMLRRTGSPGAQEEHRHDVGLDDQRTEHLVQRSTVHDVLRTPGRPLNDDTREEMETRLGADFSDVRIHVGAAAQVSAAEIGARAYTAGNHVVIGEGGADKHTLAHELTHVIQQRQGPVAGADNGTGLRVSNPSDRFEREAEANASRVMSGPALARADVRGSTSHQSAAGEQSVQRAPDVQDRLTDAYWRGQQPQGKPPQGPRPRSSERELKEIITETIPELLRQFEKKYKGKKPGEIQAMGNLEIFRGMKRTDADAIMDWWNNDRKNDTTQWIKKNKNNENVVGDFHAAGSGDHPVIGAIPVTGHLGDEAQARTYSKRDDEALVRFTLKPGAHELLFSPDYMAVAGVTPGHAPQALRNIHGPDKPMPEASQGEGSLGGYIGMKQEKKGDFSLSLGNNKASQLLFQHFIKTVEIVN
ncbi:DUF4157 domain-containing protein [Streptomyces sp. NPDC019224]|uniref:eCIS core domain-containing protein n=1 Tax=Streptomyces sp. NPDC019224 TaxID=3154484 RepID=UPI0033F1C570